jgi:hypothetical protein
MWVYDFQKPKKSIEYNDFGVDFKFLHNLINVMAT